MLTVVYIVILKQFNLYIKTLQEIIK